MEPISVALTAFTAIKAGVTAGKEISSLAGDLGKLWDACDAANARHSKKRNSQFNMSANEEVLSTLSQSNKQKTSKTNSANSLYIREGISLARTSSVTC